MVDWKSLVNIELEGFGLIKLIYFVIGVLTWEVSSTVYFDWQFITGKRVFKWPYLLYVGSRFCTCSSVILAAVVFDITTRIDCQVWTVLIYANGFMGMAFASALLALRTIAFWNGNKIVIGLVALLLVLLASFITYVIITGRGQWFAGFNSCVAINANGNLKFYLATPCVDLALLAIMLVKIWHRRKAGELWNLVYRQGLLWVAGATAGELPCIILIWFNFNDVMNVLLVPVASLAATLCATKMYQELCEYASPIHSQHQYSSIDISPMKATSSIHPSVVNYPDDIFYQPGGCE